MKEILIKDKVFSAQNLSKNTFSNGDAIFLAKSKEEWENACDNKMPAIRFPNYDSSQINVGFEYNVWVILDERRLTPEGWRMISREDYSEIMRIVNARPDFVEDRMRELMEVLCDQHPDIFSDFDEFHDFFTKNISGKQKDEVDLGAANLGKLFEEYVTLYFESLEDHSINSFFDAQGFYQSSERLELWLFDKTSKDLSTLRLLELRYTYTDNLGNRVTKREPTHTVEVIVNYENGMEKEEVEARFWYGDGVKLEDVLYKGNAVRCVKL